MQLVNLFKLDKDENNTGISLYEIYSSKLHEYILKYYGLNLFKEIAIDFKYGFQTTLETSASLFDSLFV